MLTSYVATSGVRSCSLLRFPSVAISLALGARERSQFLLVFGFYGENYVFVKIFFFFFLDFGFGVLDIIYNVEKCNLYDSIKEKFFFAFPV